MGDPMKYLVYGAGTMGDNLCVFTVTGSWCWYVCKVWTSRKTFKKGCDCPLKFSKEIRVIRKNDFLSELCDGNW